jgi:hypothetical protein
MSFGWNASAILMKNDLFMENQIFMVIIQFCFFTTFHYFSGLCNLVDVNHDLIMKYPCECHIHFITVDAIQQSIGLCRGNKCHCQPYRLY